MSQRADVKAASRAAIVRSAAALVREAGTSGMSVPAAMRGAGLTQGAFYAHFDSKDALLTTAFEHALAEAVQMVDDAAAGRSGIDAVIAVADRYLSEEHRDRPDLGCPLPALFGEAAAASEVRDRDLLAHGLATMCDRIESAGGRAVDAESAMGIVVLLVGAQVTARALRGTSASTAALATSRALIVDLLRAPRSRDQ